MKKHHVFSFIVLLAAWAACLARKESSKAEQVKGYYIESIDSATLAFEDFQKAVESGKGVVEVQHMFKEARLKYKKTEFFTEYYSPSTAKSINGAPIPEIDVDDQHRIILPSGFQVIEAYIFPTIDGTNKEELVREIRFVAANLRRLKDLTTSIYPTDRHVFDALKLEVFRIVSLGISGFDAALSLNSMEEAGSSLSSLDEVIKIYKDTLASSNLQLYSQCTTLLREAQVFLYCNRNFNKFDRLAFITKYANPLSASIQQLAIAGGIKPFNEPRALKANAYNMFEKDAFDADYYTYNSDLHSSKEKLELGKMLFFDPILSGTGKRSCASCHNTAKAFTDGEVKSKSISGRSTVFRNTPTVLNAGLQPSLFYDVRVAYLEDQASEVINNKEEMHGSLAEAIKLLERSAGYSNSFKKAFPKAMEPINELNLKNAIASYVRSLTSLDSPFDKYVRGDKDQLNHKEINGFNLFMGKAKCGTCHFTPLFNGNVPPNFTKTESEVIGVPVSAVKNQIDTDPGKYNLRHLEMHRNAFRTPTVRNIALTAPYMHNGIYKTLEEVVEFYNKGGGVGLGMVLENQTLPFDKLNLSEQEKKDIVAFLKKLTDTSAAQDVPRELPALDKSSRIRKVVYSY